MPWSAQWDEDFLDAFRRLAHLRRTRPALQRGGIRWVHVDAETIAFLRETRVERLLCVASRASIDGIPAGPFDELEPLYESAQFQIWKVVH
jgi:alpha-glucosidase